MKKTLITLAALAMASVASAASDGVADHTFTAPTTIDTNFAGAGASYTMLFVIDWDQAIADLGIWSAKSEVKIGSGSGLWWEHGLKLFKGHDGDANNLYAGFVIDNADASPTQGSGASLPGDGANVEFKMADYKINGNLVLTLVYDHDAATYSLGALKNDMTVTYATTSKTWDPSGYNYVSLGTPEGVVERVLTYDSVLTGSALAYAAQTAIPEPTTATLSLLALAGLAARRRRK